MGTETSAIHTFRIALAMLLWLTLLTGLVYPALITGIGNLLFPSKCKGSLIVRNGKVIGSHLIGQYFDNPAYFWGRPSATSPYPYNAAASSGSNLGPMNPALMQRVQERLVALQKEGAIDLRIVPVDLVTASASGLDPHISRAAAYCQVPRVARLRGIKEEQINQLIDRNTTQRTFGILGEPVVNVLELNVALDQTAPLKAQSAGNEIQTAGLPVSSEHD